MGYESPDIDFALIGHQDCWKKVTCFVDFLSNGSRSLPAEKISEVYSFTRRPPVDIPQEDTDLPVDSQQQSE